jgi:hypothetical protein
MVQTDYFTNDDPQKSPTYRRLGLINGLLIGAALSAGIWGGPLFLLADLPMPLRYEALLLQIVITIVVCTLVGWLTARIAKTGLTILIWFVCALFIAYSLIHLPERLRTLVVWLADSRFWGLPVYSPPQVPAAAPYLLGFFLILLLFVFAILQDYRLEGIQHAVGQGGRWGLGVWLRLLLPLPVMCVIGLVTAEMTNTNYAWWSAVTTHQVVQGVIGYDGDLFELSRQEGLNFNALRGVRDQLTPVYTLNIAEIDDESSSTTVAIHFNNGAWVNCQFVADNLLNCFEATRPYTSGLNGIIQGVPIPDPVDCRGCFPRVDEEWSGWLQARHDRLGDSPDISRLAQWGSFVLMRLEAGDYAVECLFQGVSPVRLESCQEEEGD